MAGEKKRPLLPWLLATGLGLCLALALFLNARHGESFLGKKNGELPVYVLAAERLWAGQEIYRPEDRKPFTYPPFMAVPFLPFLLLPDYAHRPVWYAVNLLLLGFCLWLLNRNLLLLGGGRGNQGKGPRPWFYWLLVLLLAGRHVSSTLENQSNDYLVLCCLLLAVDASCRRDERYSGLYAGLGAALKATPLLYLPAFLWQRRFAAAVAVVLGMAAALLAADFLFLRQDGGSWTLAWYRTFLQGVEAGSPVAGVGGAWSSWNILNQNLAGTLYRLSTAVTESSENVFDVSLWQPASGTLKLVTLAAQLLVLGLVLWPMRPGLSRGLPPHELAWRRFGEGALIACGMVLLSPMSSKSHFCVLLLPVAFCVQEQLYGRRRWWMPLYFVLLFGIGTLTVKDLWGRQLGNQILARGSVTACALLSLLATVWLLWRPSGKGAHTPAGQ